MSLERYFNYQRGSYSLLYDANPSYRGNKKQTKGSCFQFEFQLPSINQRKMHLVNTIENCLSNIDEAMGGLEYDPTEKQNWKMRSLHKRRVNMQDQMKRITRKRNTMLDMSMQSSKRINLESERKMISIPASSSTGNIKDDILKDREKKEEQLLQNHLKSQRNLADRSSEKQKMKFKSHNDGLLYLTELHSETLPPLINLNSPLAQHSFIDSSSQRSLKNKEVSNELSKMKLQNLKCSYNLHHQSTLQEDSVMKMKNKIKELIASENRKVGNDIEDYLKPENFTKKIFLDMNSPPEEKDEYMKNFDFFLSKLKNEDTYRLRSIIKAKLGLDEFPKMINGKVVSMKKMSEILRHRKVEDILENSIVVSKNIHRSLIKNLYQ